MGGRRARPGIHRQAAQLHGGEHPAQVARLDVPQQARHDTGAGIGCVLLRDGRIDPAPAGGLLFGGGGEFQEQVAPHRVRFGGGHLAIEPGGFLLVVPAVGGGGHLGT